MLALAQPKCLHNLQPGPSDFSHPERIENGRSRVAQMDDSVRPLNARQSHLFRATAYDVRWARHMSQPAFHCAVAREKKAEFEEEADFDLLANPLCDRAPEQATNYLLLL